LVLREDQPVFRYFFHRKTLQFTTQSAVWENLTDGNGIPIGSHKTRPKVSFFVQFACKTIEIMDQFLPEAILVMNSSHIAPSRKLKLIKYFFKLFLYFNSLFIYYSILFSL